MREHLNRDWKFTEEYKESLLDVALDTSSRKEFL